MNKPNVGIRKLLNKSDIAVSLIPEILENTNSFYRKLATTNNSSTPSFYPERKESFKNINASIEKTFSMNRANISSKCLIERFIKVGRFRNPELIGAVLLFLQTLQYIEVDQKTNLNKCSLKLFCACLTISQKLLKGRVYSNKFMAMLTGLKQQELSKLEIYLLDQILNFNITLSVGTLFDCCEWIIENLGTNTTC